MTPANGGYMVAAYVISAVLYAGYSAWLLWRGRKP
jgi:hypothetical protein